uniref:Pancreatic trypsin inhibitor n=1 Tax=Rhipicephalus appendiculatus TaxID=34631 RepID=A0A131YTL2_RHIAP
MSRISIIMAFVVVVYVASALGWLQPTDTNTTDAQSLNTTLPNKSKLNGTITDKERKKNERYLCKDRPRYRRCRASFTQWFDMGGNRCKSFTGCVYGGFDNPYKCDTVCGKNKRRRPRPRPRPKERN